MPRPNRGQKRAKTTSPGADANSDVPENERAQSENQVDVNELAVGDHISVSEWTFTHDNLVVTKIENVRMRFSSLSQRSQRVTRTA